MLRIIQRQQYVVRRFGKCNTFVHIPASFRPPIYRHSIYRNPSISHADINVNGLIYIQICKAAAYHFALIVKQQKIASNECNEAIFVYYTVFFEIALEQQIKIEYCSSMIRITNHSSLAGAFIFSGSSISPLIAVSSVPSIVSSTLSPVATLSQSSYETSTV